MLIDLSHPIEDGMAVYPGLPQPEVRPYRTHAESRASYAPGTEFEFTALTLVGNVGTYLDSPYHRYHDKDDISRLPLERLVDLPAVVVDAEPRAGSIELGDQLAGACGAAVLVRTGWDERWGTEQYWQPGPHLSAATAQALVDAGAVLVGVDFWNVDGTSGGERPVHSTLLGHGVLIVEHMCRLDALPRSGATVTVAPLAVVGAASVPVRAWARLPS
ncbi:MAG: cyclase family protein [Frankiaceae bacterium]